MDENNIKELEVEVTTPATPPAEDPREATKRARIAKQKAARAAREAKSRGPPRATPAGVVNVGSYVRITGAPNRPDLNGHRGVCIVGNGVYRGVRLATVV